MAYLDELTDTVYDGNFKIKNGQKIRIYTTYKVYITINKTKYETLCNSENKKYCMTSILKALAYKSYKLKGFDYESSNIIINIEKYEDKPYEEINFKKIT